MMTSNLPRGLLAVLTLVAMGTACSDAPTAPVDAAVPLPTSAVDVAVGADYSCALVGTGDAYCWGANYQGQLGDGSTVDRFRPSRVLAPEPLVQISAGDRTACGLSVIGNVWCWGGGEFGQRGDSTLAFIGRTPTRVRSALRFSKVAVGGDFACALATDGFAWCWGHNAGESAGALAHGDTISIAIPQRIVDTLRFASLAAGVNHMCALAMDGTPYCWGANRQFQVAGPFFFSPYVPGPVPATRLYRFASLSAGKIGTCGVTSEGAAYCWGTDELGSLGLGTYVEGGTSRVVPERMRTAYRFQQLALGDGDRRFTASCGISTEGRMLCWGDDSTDIVNDPTANRCSIGISASERHPCVLVPMPRFPDLRFVRVANSGQHACAVTTKSDVVCWGSNARGALGRAQ